MKGTVLMAAWIPSLITSGVVIIITVGSVILSTKIQLAKLESKMGSELLRLESKFDTKFDSLEKDIHRLDAKIDAVEQRLSAKIDATNQRVDRHLEGHS